MGGVLTCFETTSGPSPYGEQYNHLTDTPGFMDGIHQHVGGQVARSLRDEETQARLGSQVGEAAKNKAYQQQVGSIGTS